jgi:hypothetical protein
MPLLSGLPAARLCAADAAYDSDGFRLFLRQRGTIPVIPNNPTRKRTHPFDTQVLKIANPRLTVSPRVVDPSSNRTLIER